MIRASSVEDITLCTITDLHTGLSESVASFGFFGLEKVVINMQVNHKICIYL